MTGNNVLADTNVFIEIMKGNADFAQRLQRCSCVYLSPFVQAELYFGAYRSVNVKKHLDKVDTVVKKTKPVIVDSFTAEIFVQIKFSLINKGQPIPENDIWIAASALQHGLPVFTNDAHFAEVENLQRFF